MYRDLIYKAVKSPYAYEESLPSIISIIGKGGTSESKLIITHIKSVLKDKSKPQEKLLALEIFQACMLLNKSDFLIQAQLIILKKLVSLAQSSNTTIFKDSTDSIENKECSEKFLYNLLNYIYIWANEFGLTQDRKPNEFSKAFYKLRETVIFPSSKPKESIRRSLTLKKANSENYNFRDKFNLEVVEGLLETLEESSTTDAASKQVVKSLNLVKPEFEKYLDRVLNSNNSDQIQRSLEINDRMQRLSLNLEKNECANDIRRQKSFPVVHSNILDLELSSDIVLDDSDTEKNNPFFQSYFMNGITPTIPKPVSTTPTHHRPSPETDLLKKIISQKESENLILSQNCAKYQAYIRQLEEVLNKTKELLVSKEKECEEYHCLKNNLKGSNEFEPTEIVNSTNINISTPLANRNFVQIPEEKTADNEAFIKFACCDASDVMFEDHSILLKFQGQLEDSHYKIFLLIFNKSSESLAKVRIEVESAFGFDINLVADQTDNIAPNTQLNSVISANCICPTHITPIIKLKYTGSTGKKKYCIKLPLSLCSFSKAINQNLSELWTEWDFLAFDNEVMNCKLECPLDICQKLVKISKNAVILIKSNSSSLNTSQFLIVFNLSKKVFALLTLKPLEMSIEIEIRTEQISLRKPIVLLIVKQINT